MEKFKRRWNTTQSSPTFLIIFIEIFGKTIKNSCLKDTFLTKISSNLLTKYVNQSKYPKSNQTKLLMAITKTGRKSQKKIEEFINNTLIFYIKLYLTF